MPSGTDSPRRSASVGATSNEDLTPFVPGMMPLPARYAKPKAPVWPMDTFRDRFLTTFR